METKVLLETYLACWGFEHYNASAGLEFGRRDSSRVTNWPRCDRWKKIADLVSFSIRIWRMEVMFRFYHPGEWRTWALIVHPTRG